MANTNYYSKTNYFKVTDEEKLREIVSKMEDASVNKENDTFIIYGFCSLLTYSSDDDSDDKDTVNAIQKILPNGEAVSIIEVCNEKLCYIGSFITVFNNKECVTLDVLEWANEQRNKLGGRL